MIRGEEMLKDRVTMSSESFTVNTEPGQERELYYGRYSYEDAPDYVPEKLEKGKYWQSMKKTNENPLYGYGEEANKADKPLLYIEERQSGKIVEEDRRKCFDSSEREKIDVYFEKPPRGFSRSACMISFVWERWSGVRINAGYFFLKDRTGERYPFLRKLIYPQENNKGGLEDRFIFEVQEGFTPDDYTVEIDPLIKERYKIVIHQAGGGHEL